MTWPGPRPLKDSKRSKLWSRGSFALLLSEGVCSGVLLTFRGQICLHYTRQTKKRKNIIWSSTSPDINLDKSGRLIIRLLFGFVFDFVFSICQTQQKYQQIVENNAVYQTSLFFMSVCISSSVNEWNINIDSLILSWKSSIWFIRSPRI